jgi:biotin carboxylase
LKFVYFLTTNKKEIHYTSLKIGKKITIYTISKNSMNRILIVEPKSSGWMLIPKGKELGYHITVMVCEKNKRSIPEKYIQYADHVVLVDTNNSMMALSVAYDLHAENKFDAVLPGHEYYVTLTAKISSLLGLPGLDPKYVNQVRLKDSMRSTLQDAGIRTPLFILVTSETELEKVATSIGYPCVLKPVDCGGSLNVRKVTNQEELIDAFKVIMNTPVIETDLVHQPKVLVEEFLDGPEYSVEGYIENNKPIFLSITEKFLGVEPYFVEIGHIVSPQLPTSIEQSIYSYIESVTKTLNLDIGPFHCELRLIKNSPILIEAAARLAGDRICDLIHYATGFDLYKIMYNCFLGIPNLQQQRQINKFAGIHFFTNSQLTTYSTIQGIEKIKNISGFVELNLLKKPGEFIPFPSSYLGRIGYAIFTHENYNELKSILENLDTLIEFS